MFCYVLQEFEEVVTDRMLSQQLLQMVINVQAAVIRSDHHENHWREFESNILLLVCGSHDYSPLSHNLCTTFAERTSHPSTASLNKLCQPTLG